MTIRLFNTLSNTVEALEPIDGETLRIYVCGPTVYDYGHIGNFRTFLQLDILRRFLKQEGRKLLQVMNITDVDDKIIRNAAAAHLTIEKYTEKYEAPFSRIWTHSAVNGRKLSPGPRKISSRWLI